MTTIGPHLLGRIESPLDLRDYNLDNFLHFAAPTAGDDVQSQADALVELAVAELKKTTITYARWAARSYADVTVTHWWKALNALQQAHVLLSGEQPVPPPAPTGDVVWENPDDPLDQGDFGTCVGNGDAQFGNTSPINDHFTEKDARKFYYEATVLDGDPDDPDAPNGGQQGATVRSGVKVLKNHGRISTYAQATSTDAITAWLKKYGPVIIGSDWMNDMFTPDSKGYVRPTGGVAGGHCYVIVGYLASEGAYLCLNSWGKGWGQGGYFKIKVADFGQLLGSGGEAWTSVELALPQLSLAA